MVGSEGADVEPHLATLASGSHPGQEPFLFGVDEDGTVHLSRDAGLTWEMLY